MTRHILQKLEGNLSEQAVAEQPHEIDAVMNGMLFVICVVTLLMTSGMLMLHATW
jgi:hypothetical protein